MTMMLSSALRRLAPALALCLALQAGCVKRLPQEAPQERQSYRFKAPDRIVAIGDLHGDIEATRHALRLAGALGPDDHWAGGHLVVVQTGDQLDRGEEERAILELFEALQAEAAQAGGALYRLNGNHEVMNVQGDFRYVTLQGFQAFEGTKADPISAAKVTEYPTHAQGRAAAFLPGGPWARKLARGQSIIVVEDTVFVHGGVRADHVRYGIARINRELSQWMTGALAQPQEIILGRTSPLWVRLYSDGEIGPEACEELAEVLEALDAQRMVIGHTVQKDRINPACGGRVWRIDVGLASHYGGPLQVLEIKGGQVRVVEGPRGP